MNIGVYIKEISKPRKFELKLNQKELCESFIESNRDPILLLDLDATIVLANRTFSQLLGWRKENLEGFHILSCPSIPPHLVEQMRDYYQRVVSSQYNSDSDLFTLETIRVSNDEKAYHMMLSITPIYDHFGEVCNWAVHLRDITVQKETEKSLIRAEKLLAIGQIAAGLTHEIRNPLQSLKGLTQLIKTSPDEVVNFDGYLDLMIEELRQIETFVDGFALFGRTKLNSYKMTDITFLVQEVIDLLNSQALLSNVHIKLEYVEVPNIWSEEGLLKQAILNVIQNGIESMFAGGTLHITIRPDGDRIEMNVIDYGVGIPEDRFQKLGEPFYSNNEKGFGLGLMLTYKIIEQHHGKISIQSKVGLGTQVTISFPISNKV
jgi:PAS domain S-box-containing protein